MNKEFDIWNGKKKIINNERPRAFFHEREIWFCHMGENVDFEQDGKGENFGCPVIVFKKFNKEVFWAIPLTTRDKGGKFYLAIDLQERIINLCRLPIP